MKRMADFTVMVGAQELHGEVLDGSQGNVWQTLEPISREDYNALPLEAGWVAVGIGTGNMDEHWFTRSPGAEEDGPMEEREIGGQRFVLCARPAGASTQPEGREGPRLIPVQKHHGMRFGAGREIGVLRRSDGERFVHVIEGGKGKPPLDLPEGWQVETVKLARDWVLQLPTPATVYFFPNGDSYQGPLAELPG